MNSSHQESNFTNSSIPEPPPPPFFFFTYDQVYNLFGYYYHFTIMYTVLSCIGFVAFALNAGSLWILSDKREFNIPLYTYMRVYRMSSTLSCFSNAVGYIVFNAAHFTRLYNLYLTAYIGTYVYYVLFQTGYFFATLLDILISLDRIALFHPPTNRFLKRVGYYTSPYKICILLYSFCLLFGVFNGWTSGKASITLPMEGGKLVTFWYTVLGTPDLDYTLWLVFAYITYILRDVVPLIALIVLSIVLVVVYRNYTIKRMALFNSRNQVGSLSMEGSTGLARTNNDSNVTATSGRASKSERVSGMDKKLVAMTSLLCLFGIFEHVVAMAFLVIVLTVATGGVDATTLSGYMSIIFWILNLAVTLKQGSGFFLLLGFNKVFRTELKKKWAKLRGGREGN